MLRKRLTIVDNDEPRTNNPLSAESGALVSNDNLLENERKLYELIQEAIQEKYQEVLDGVTMFVEQEEDKDVSEIKLLFANEPNNRAIAWASYEANTVTFNIARHFKPSILKTAAHEIAHIITGKYLSKQLSHSLEFAIICYCIQYKLRIRTEDFFVAYDIRDEVSKPFLEFNFSQFDSYIKCISWNSLRELADKSKKLADELREKSVPLNLFSR